MSDLISWWAPWSGRGLVAAIFLAGMVAALWGLRRRRSARPRCRKCAYDLTGLAHLRCPECGWIASNDAAARRGPRRWRLVIAGLIIACALPAYVFVKRTRQYGWEYYLTFGPGHYFFGMQTMDEVSIGRGRVRILRDRSPVAVERFLEIRSGSSEEDQHIEAWGWQLGVTLKDGGSIGRGDDVTGNGRPNIIAVEHSGGAHCCATYHVFEAALDGVLRELAVIEALHGGGFEDLDGDAIPEFVTHDWTWAYALTCYACLHYPVIVLQFDGHAYVAQPNLMRAPAPSESSTEFLERIRQLAPDRSWNRRDLTWSEMLQRIYTGHANLAWPLFEAAWEPQWGEKQQLLGDFIGVLKTSPHLDALIELNGGDDTLRSAVPMRDQRH